MMTKMKRVFGVLMLLVSLAMLMLLACGYVCRMDVERYSVTPSYSKPPGQLVSLTLDEGRVRWWSESWVPVPPAGPGVHVLAKLRPVPPSRLGRAVWEFDAHPVPTASATGWAYIVAFPIWCAALPWLIAPGLWLWRRRRRRDLARGFDIVGS